MDLATPGIRHDYSEDQEDMATESPVGGSPFEPSHTGTIPDQTHPAIHTLAAIEQIRNMTAMVESGSETHRNLAYAATAAAECIDWLDGWHQHDEETLESLPRYPLRPALQITAAILGGHPDDPVSIPDEYPEEGKICQLIKVLPEHDRRYVCSGSDPNLERSDPCRQCLPAGRSLHRSSVVAILDEIGNCH